MKFVLLAFLVCISTFVQSQYIAVRAKYTDTRLVDDAPNPPKRENRLVLSFYEVSGAGVYTPVSLTNYDLYVYKAGLQFGNLMGGVFDSTGNNYPGYAWPAPRAVSYFNTLGINFIDCNPHVATHYIVNGQQLDCGYVTVSYWDIDGGTGQPIECFPAPNICLPYYLWPDPYYYMPGNLNFGCTDICAGPPYNLYNFHCGGTLQLVMRGILSGDSSGAANPLPVSLAHVGGEVRNANTVHLWWSNLTESGVDRYEVMRSTGDGPFVPVDTVIPTNNDSGRADYYHTLPQTANTALYKIKVVENSGRITYSIIIHLRLPATNGPAPGEPVLTIYPNPVTGNVFTFQLQDAPEGRYVSEVVNAAGTSLRQKLIRHNGADLTRQIDLDGLPAGIYQLVLRGESRRYTQTILYVH